MGWPSSYFSGGEVKLVVAYMTFTLGAIFWYADRSVEIHSLLLGDTLFDGSKRSGDAI